MAHPVILFLFFTILSLGWGLFSLYLFPDPGSVDGHFYRDLMVLLANPGVPALPYNFDHLIHRPLADPGPYYWGSGGPLLLAPLFWLLRVWCPGVPATNPLLWLLPLYPLMSLVVARRMGFSPAIQWGSALLALFSGTYTINLLEYDNYLLYGVILSFILLQTAREAGARRSLYWGALLAGFCLIIRPEGVVIPWIYWALGRRGRDFGRVIVHFLIGGFLSQGVLRLWINPTPVAVPLSTALFLDYHQLFHWEPLATLSLASLWPLILLRWDSMWVLGRTLLTSILPFYSLPFVGVGFLSKSTDEGGRIRIAGITALGGIGILYFLIFPLPGSNGGLYHALAFAPILFSPLIVAGIADVARERGVALFLAILFFNVFYSLALNFERWSPEEDYRLEGVVVISFARRLGIENPVVMCQNPIYFHRDTGLRAVMVPLDLGNLTQAYDFYRGDFLVFPPFFPNLSGFKLIFRNERLALFVRSPIPKP